MTNHHGKPTATGDGGTWPGLCPTWCVTDHSGSEHPDDQQHRGPAWSDQVLAGLGPWPLELTQHDVMVYLAKARDALAPSVRLDLGPLALTLTPSSAKALASALIATCQSLEKPGGPQPDG